MNDELNRIDLKIIHELDTKVVEQQDTMKKAGVPGFYLTSDPVELRVQMYIFEFIQNLGSMSLPSWVLIKIKHDDDYSLFFFIWKFK